MYVALLSAVLAHDEPMAISRDSLLDAVVDCRTRMARSKVGANVSARHALAYEIAYDHALVRLCTAGGIHVDPEGFSHPRQERARLERALTESGVDLRAAGNLSLQGQC